MSKHKFQPGQSGNPDGRPKLPDDLRHLIEATGQQVKRDICEVYNTKLETIRSLQSREDLSAGLAMLAACMVNAIATGDNRIMATFLDRIIGKPKETVELSGTEANGFKIVVEDYTKK